MRGRACVFSRLAFRERYEFQVVGRWNFIAADGVYSSRMAGGRSCSSKLWGGPVSPKRLAPLKPHSNPDEREQDFD